jgi:hypothetical protein
MVRRTVSNEYEIMLKEAAAGKFELLFGQFPGWFHETMKNLIKGNRSPNQETVTYMSDYRRGSDWYLALFNSYRT